MKLLRHLLDWCLFKEELAIQNIPWIDEHKMTMWVIKGKLPPAS